MVLSGWYLGILFIFLVGVLWTGGSMVTQYIYEDLDFKSPFLVTYISTSLFALYLPIWKIMKDYGMTKDHSWNKQAKLPDTHPGTSDNHQNSIEAVDELNSAAMDEEYNPLIRNPSLNDSLVMQKQDTYNIDTELCHVDIIKLSTVLAIVWFVSNALYSYSLLWTSITSSTIISNLSSAFTLFCSYYMGLEEISWLKIGGIFLCFLGVTAITLQDQKDDDQGQSFLGDMMALFSALGYGVYTTYLRYHVPTENIVCMELI